MSPKVIPKEHLEDFQRWELPAVDGPTVGDAASGEDQAAEPMSLPTAEQIEALQKQAYDEAFAQGYKEGLDLVTAESKRQLQAYGRRLDELMSTLAHPFAELDRQVEQELVALASALARQLVLQELRIDPGLVVATVREALAALPVAARDPALYLHPDDAVLVREALSLSESERSWRIVEDPQQARGGCRVVTETSQIDASIETRLAAVITSVFGGDRAADTRTPESGVARQDEK